MKRARVAYNGALHQATPAEEGVLRLADGRLVGEDKVVWLPPVDAGTVFALAINYADHARELDFAKPGKPLVFLKSAHALIGHDAVTRRPDEGVFMHYECELAVVIGRAARHVAEADALAHVAGYAVANDYAIRNTLENYYRPNLRTKNRDGCTVLGPWLVDAADVADPMDLRLTTHVNGVQTQSGTTRDMVFGVAELVAYLSSLMTLAPGDVILTGTPEGVADVKAGDEIITEIGGIGRLRNRITDDAGFFRPDR